jgi:hypothetical protein
MKKLIGLIICLLLAGAVSASQFGVEVEKAVNGGYEVSAPVVLDAQSKLPFLPKAYLKAAPIFTSPRSDVTRLNHSRMDMVVGGGITLFKGNLEFETGASYWWAGNDQGIPEGWEWCNSIRYYWVF